MALALARALNTSEAQKDVNGVFIFNINMCFCLPKDLTESFVSCLWIKGKNVCTEEVKSNSHLQRLYLAYGNHI